VLPRYYRDLLEEKRKRKDEALVSIYIGMLRNRPNSLNRICKIDVSAFASIMFVLGFTMMVAESTARPPHGTGVDLPRVWHPVAMWRGQRGCSPRRNKP
jgi:hypothetical protein